MKLEFIKKINLQLTIKYAISLMLILIVFYNYSKGFSSIIRVISSQKISEKVVNSSKVIQSTIYNSFSFRVLNFLNSKLNFDLQDPNCNEECSNNCNIQSIYQDIQFRLDYLKKCMEDDCSCILKNDIDNINLFFSIIFSVFSIISIYLAYKVSLRKEIIMKYSYLSTNETIENVNNNQFDGGFMNSEEENGNECELNNEYNDRLL